MTQVVWDTETYPNFFAVGFLHMFGDYYAEFECSEYRDDSPAMFDLLRMFAREQVELIGFNSLGFDYPVIHHLIRNCFNDRGEQIRFGVDVARAAYDKAEMIIRSQDRFGHQVWQSDRFIPQIDLYKVNHFDNIAKSTSLKVLQFTMHADSVEDLPIAPGTRLTAEQAVTTLKYMRHDIDETKRFAGFSADAIAFRRELSADMTGDVLNWSDVKIGSEMLIQRLGKKVCYHYVDDKREPRQTPRHMINVADIVFPYIKFERPECRALLERFQAHRINAATTKAAFSDSIELDGFAFHFGTGGVHGSVEKRAFHSSADMVIIDADVTSLYPSIAIENNLAPEHLGERFTQEYSKLRAQRALTKKGDPRNAALKLALNGTYGNSNNAYSPFYDPLYTMQTTINGQLLLLMLAERLLAIPGLVLIQINTDGITAAVPRKQMPNYDNVWAGWVRETNLQLEFAEYRSMFVRDVNAYVAVGTDGKIKRKGAYDFPTPEQPIGTAPSGPRAWHGDSSYMVMPMAADAALVKGVPVEVFIREHKNPFDFMGRYKTPGGSKLIWGRTDAFGGVQQQRVTRFYRATGERAGSLIKESPPPDHAYALPGAYKRKNGITDAEFNAINREVPAGTWDGRIHTANKSVYADRVITVAQSARVCNRAVDFDWSSVDYEWYIAEAAKLVDCFTS